MLRKELLLTSTINNFPFYLGSMSLEAEKGYLLSQTSQCPEGISPLSWPSTSRGTTTDHKALS